MVGLVETHVIVAGVTLSLLFSSGGGGANTAHYPLLSTLGLWMSFTGGLVFLYAFLSWLVMIRQQPARGLQVEAGIVQQAPPPSYESVYPDSGQPPPPYSSVVK